MSEDRRESAGDGEIVMEFGRCESGEQNDRQESLGMLWSRTNSPGRSEHAHIRRANISLPSRRISMPEATLADRTRRGWSGQISEKRNEVLCGMSFHDLRTPSFHSAFRTLQHRGFDRFRNPFHDCPNVARFTRSSHSEASEPDYGCRHTNSTECEEKSQRGTMW